MKRQTKIFMMKIYLILLVLPLCANIYAQNKAKVNIDEKVRVKGTIVDEKGDPLIGATVSVKGTAYGTVANLEGKYSIEVPAKSTLTFNMVGYAEVNEPIEGRYEINVTMKDEAKVLADVVVVGYGTQKKVSVTGSISSISPKEIQMAATPSLSNALGGKLAGIVSRQSSGEPGYDQASVYIRGLGTWTNSNPLVLVDGVERDLNTVNSQEIENLSILKDASATAVYGVKGANGVILINTKKGRVGKPTVILRSEFATLSSVRLPQYVDGAEYAGLINEALVRSGKQPGYTEEDLALYRSGGDPYLHPNVDWLGLILKKHSPQTINNLSITGGADIVRYYINIGYTMQDGIYKEASNNNYKTNTNLQHYSFRSNLDIDLTRELTMNIGVGGYIDGRRYPGNSGYAIFDAARNMSPIIFPAQNPDGSPGGVSTYLGQNPYGMATQSGYSIDRHQTFQSNFGAKWDLSKLVTPGLSISGKFAYDLLYYAKTLRYQQYEVKEYVGKDPITNEDIYNVYREGLPMGYQSIQLGNRSVYYETILNYDRVWGLHSFGGMLLGSRREYLDLSANDRISGQPYRNQGVAMRLAYSYDSKYLFEVNAGYNGSENFAKRKKYGLFPSVSAGYIITNEKFWNFKPISHLKLRASFGQVGNDQIGGARFLYLTTMDPNATGMTLGNEYSLKSGIGELQTGTPDVTWETATKTNIGIDMNLFNNKLTLQIDGFYEYRNNILMQRQSIPEIAGYNSVSLPYANIGIVKNKGLDAALEFKTQYENGFFYSVRGNFTYVHNTVIEDDQSKQQWQNLVTKGHPIGQPWGMVAIGLFKDQADISNSHIQEIGDAPKPGDIKYLDVNKDGVINSNDQTAIGFSRIPEIVYGLGGTIGYKNVDLSLYFTGAARTSLFLEGNSMWPFNQGLATFNVLKEYYGKRWVDGEDNSHAVYPAVSEVRNTNNFVRSTLWQKDASYLRLKTAEVGYNVSPKLIKKSGLTSVRLFVNGMNLLTFDKIKIIDPESNNGTGNYPVQRSINGGFQINF